MKNLPTAVIAFALFIFPSLVAYLNRSAALALVIAAVAALIHTIKTKSPWPKPDPVMTAFLLWGALSAFWEYDQGLALPETLQLLGLLVAGSTLCTTLSHLPEDQARLIKRAAIGGALLSIGLFAMDWAGDCIVLHAAQGLRNKPDRLGCWLPREKALPAILSIFTPLLIQWAWGNWRKMGVMAVFSVVLVLFAKVSDSHAATLALVVSLATFVGATLVGPRIMGRIVAGLAVILILSAPILPSLLPPPKALGENYPWVPNSTRHRVMIWQFTADKIAERPLLGWGLNASRSIPGNNDKSEVWLYDPNRGPADSLFSVLQDNLPLHPHDFALQIWLETGAVGAILFGAILWRLFIHIGQRWKGAGLASGAAALVIASVSFGIWQAWWLSCLWMIAAATPIILPAGPDRGNIPKK